MSHCLDYTLHHDGNLLPGMGQKALHLSGHSR